VPRRPTHGAKPNNHNISVYIIFRLRGHLSYHSPHIPATSHPQPQQFSPVQQSCSESILLLVDTNYFLRVLVISNRNVLTAPHHNALPEAIVITNRFRIYVIGAQEW